MLEPLPEDSLPESLFEDPLLELLLPPPEEPETTAIPDLGDLVEETISSADDEDAADGGDEKE